MSDTHVTKADIKTLLTLYMRSERFGDGNWASFIENGRMTAVLKRLSHFPGNSEFPGK